MVMDIIPYKEIIQILSEKLQANYIFFRCRGTDLRAAGKTFTGWGIQRPGRRIFRAGIDDALAGSEPR